MSKPALGKGLGKLLNGDPVAGGLGIPPASGSARGVPAKAGNSNSGSGLSGLINKPAAVTEQRPTLPRWYLLLVDGLLLLAAEGIVLKSDEFGLPQGLLCAALVLMGVILAIMGILESKS